MQTFSRARLATLCRALALGAALAPAISMAQTSLLTPDQQYEQDVKRCNAGQTAEDRATCLKEAGAAREAARQHKLDDKRDDHYARNALQRCNELPASQRSACVAEMQSPTRVEGSVSGGGVLRETVIPVPVGTPGSTTIMPAEPAPVVR